MTVIEPIKAQSSLIAVTVGDTGFTPAIKDAVRRERLFRRIEAIIASSPKYGCLMAMAPQLLERVTEFCAQIPAEDLHEEGIETEPHVTVFYGFHANFSEFAKLAGLRQHGSSGMTFKLGKVSRFECPEYDVLKVNVESPEAVRMNARIGEELAASVAPSKYSYNPHLTLAYVKKGACKELDGDRTFAGESFTVTDLLYSLPDKQSRCLVSLVSDPVAATEAGHPFYGNQYSVIGVVNNGSPVSKKLAAGDSHEHGDNKAALNYTAASRRWKLRKADNRVVWTNEPSEDDAFAVEDHIEKKHGIKPSGHVMHGFAKNIEFEGLLKASGGFSWRTVTASEPQSPHETARRLAARIYKAAMESWVAHYHADLLAALTANPNMDYDGVIGPELILAWRQAVGQAAIRARQATFGVLRPPQTPNRVPPQALNAFANARESALERFPGDFGDKVAASLSRGLKTDSRTGLARRLEEAINSTADVKVPLAAETEAQVAYGVSQDQALRLAGYTKKRWQTVNDERVRESHTLCEEQGAIPLNAAFHNGLTHPGDPNGPAEEVINCRCDLVGVR